MTAVDLHFSTRPGGIAQLVLDGLLLVPGGSFDVRSTVVDGEAADGTVVVRIETAPADPAALAAVPSGAVAVFDRLPAELGPEIESLARRLAGAAVTCLDDVDRLTSLVDGPVAYIGAPVPGELPQATADESITVLVGGADDAAGCPGCRWAARFGPLPATVRILRPGTDGDALCSSCRPHQDGATICVDDAWALPGLLRGQLVLAGEPHDPLYDVACRVAEATGRPVVDLTGRPVPRWGDDADDRELLMVVTRMEGLLHEVMHRRPVRVTAEELGAHFATRPGVSEVADLVGTVFGELFGRALEPTPHPVHAGRAGVPQPRNP